MRGTLNWAGFGHSGEDWFGFIYRIDRFSGTPKTSNEEGDLWWCRLDELYRLPMWERDKYFLDMVFDDNSSIFHGYMPYRDGRPLSWSYSRG